MPQIAVNDIGNVVAASRCVGDGVTDDRAAIQIAIDTAAALGGAIVRLPTQSTYLVGSVGTKLLRGSSGSDVTIPFCLDIPSKVTLDLNGSTLKLATDATLLANRTGNGTTDTDISIVNGILDGDNILLTSKSLLWFFGVTRLTFKNLLIKNTKHLASFVIGCDKCEFDDITVDGVVGTAWHFGGTVGGQDVRDSRFGIVRAYNVTREDAVNFPGNPFAGVLTRCTVDAVIARTIGAGMKLYGGSFVTINSVMISDSVETDGNSGLKIQGDGVNDPFKIAVANVVVTEQQGPGLYIDKGHEISIANYIGINNGKSGAWPDVWVAGNRNQIGRIKSDNAGQVGVQIRTDAIDYQLGDVYVRNPGNVTTPSTAVSAAGGDGTIDTIRGIDDQGTKTMNRILHLTGAAAKMRVGYLDGSGFTIAKITVASGAILILTTNNAVYNVKDFGAIGDGVADDRAAIQSVLDTVKNAGGGKVYLPKGTYLLTASASAGGITWHLAVEGDNITIECDNGAVLKSSITSVRVLLAMGASKPAGQASWFSNEYRDATAYSLTGTQTKGRNVVTLATASDANNFAAGDYVFIRTGQLVGGSADGQPDSEINLVASSDGGAGTVTLRWPLTKTYQQEWYITGVDGLTSTNPTANAAPYKISKVTDRTLFNIQFINVNIETTGIDSSIGTFTQCVNVKCMGGRFITRDYGLSGGGARYVEIVGIYLERQLGTGTSRYGIAPSFGCTNWDIHDNHVVSDTLTFIHLHEGVAQTRVHHNYVEAANASSADTMISIRSRSHDLIIDNNTLVVNYTTPGNAVQIIEGPSTGILARNKIIAGNATADIRIDQDGWFGIETNILTNGDYEYRDSLIGFGIQTTTFILSGWVVGTTGAQQLTPTLGKLPKRAIPLRVQLYVRTAFDSSGTDNIKLGFSGTLNAYFTDTDVSTTGVKTPTAGASLQIPEETAERTVIATYTAGGTAPTVGEAFVALEYAIGSMRT